MLAEPDRGFDVGPPFVSTRAERAPLARRYRGIIRLLLANLFHDRFERGLMFRR